jgi:hypothetical protein
MGEFFARHGIRCDGVELNRRSYDLALERRDRFEREATIVHGDLHDASRLLGEAIFGWKSDAMYPTVDHQYDAVSLFEVIEHAPKTGKSPTVWAWPQLIDYLKVAGQPVQGPWPPHQERRPDPEAESLPVAVPDPQLRPRDLTVERHPLLHDPRRHLPLHLGRRQREDLHAADHLRLQHLVARAVRVGGEGLHTGAVAVRHLLRGHAVGKLRRCVLLPEVPDGIDQGEGRRARWACVAHLISKTGRSAE